MRTFEAHRPESRAGVECGAVGADDEKRIAAELLSQTPTLIVQE